jgi:hypothetical protein
MSNRLPPTGDTPPHPFAAAFAGIPVRDQPASPGCPLAGECPNTLQDIREEALGPWLRDHGHVR